MNSEQEKEDFQLIVKNSYNGFEKLRLGTILNVIDGVTKLKATSFNPCQHRKAKEKVFLLRMKWLQSNFFINLKMEMENKN